MIYRLSHRHNVKILKKGKTQNVSEKLIYIQYHFKLTRKKEKKTRWLTKPKGVALTNKLFLSCDTA